ncbi:MAG TPA: ABC transporter substrate-binding protein, partial [Vicinamibacteria bacterium]|nr:ABC transporter substrate-binding protein [Vicinamibacteria bacterium]
MRRPGMAAVAALWVLPLTAAAAEAPRRVASVNLTADEILVEILPPQRLVAVTRFADEPGTSNVVGRVPPAVARFPRADIERLVALGPDLVIVSEYTDADFLKLLARSGLRVYRMRGLDSMAGFRAAILDLGRTVGALPAAQRLVARFDATLADVGRRLQGAPRPRVLYWANPHTAGSGTAIGALIECAGGTNAGAALGLRGIVPLAAERAFVADPDVVLVGTGWGTAQALR